MNHNTRPASSPDESDPRRFLEHFAIHRRSGAANLFHMAVRDGARTPVAVLDAVQAQVARRLTRPDIMALAHFRHVLEALQSDEPGALAYAQHVLDYEQLPREQRQQVKAERSIHYLHEAMRSRPVTAPQLSYLRALGWQGDPPANRAEASQLIDRLRREGRQA